MRKGQSWMLRPVLSAVCMLCLLVVSLSVPQTSVHALQAGNLLQNPGFEGTFPAINGDTSLRVATNWQPWYLPQGSSSSINARPEYRPAPSNRVRSGAAAQEFNTFFATHTGGIFQRVPVTQGTELRFSVYIYVWSSGSFANPDVSEDPNDVMVRVGIDPTGGTDHNSPNIVWSADAEFYDEWREMSVTATSAANAVTVFVRSAPQGFVGTTNVYVDDAALVPLGQAPVPTATATAIPTDTPDFMIPTQEGTVTPLPTPLATNTPLPVVTATPTLPSGFNSTIVYRVVAGDTVSEIARRYGSSIDAIATVNGLANAGFIRVGQTLIVPVQSGSTRPPTFTPVPTLVPGTGGPGDPVDPADPVITRYYVIGGETVSAIAARFNTTVATLAQLNGIVNPNLIFPGQVLTVPAGGIISPPVQPTPQPVPPTSVPQPQPLQHVVSVGENLFRISLRYNVSLDALARANGIYNWNLIFPGQVLVIPQ